MCVFYFSESLDWKDDSDPHSSSAWNFTLVWGWQARTGEWIKCLYCASFLSYYLCIQFILTVLDNCYRKPHELKGGYIVYIYYNSTNEQFINLCSETHKIIRVSIQSIKILNKYGCGISQVKISVFVWKSLFCICRLHSLSHFLEIIDMILWLSQIFMYTVDKGFIFSLNLTFSE